MPARRSGAILAVRRALLTIWQAMTASNRKQRRSRLWAGEAQPDSHSQRLLDIAVLKQALLDVRLRIERVPRREREACTAVMLDAARWLFANRHPLHILSPVRIAERMGVDYRKLAWRVFESLPPARQVEIREGLRHYTTCVLKAA